MHIKSMHKSTERSVSASPVSYDENYKFLKLSAVFVEANMMSKERAHLSNSSWTTWHE
jgi:hypothetical protein